MSYAGPGRHATPMRRREVVRTTVAVIVVAVAAVIVVDDADAAACARLALVVALLMMSHWALERRLTRRVQALEARRDRADYWKIYADVLIDLGGLDGETSTDHGQLPGRR